MPRAKADPPEEVAPTRTYSVISPAGHHTPDGFTPLGGTIDLTDAQAERGLAAGLLVPTPE